MTTRALLIAVEEYEEPQLSALPGTVDRALAFRRWLIEENVADPGDVLMCTHPMSPEAQFGATSEHVLDAITQLVDIGQNDTELLFVMHTGHGFQYRRDEWTEKEDVLVGSGFKAARGGAGCLPLQQIRTYLAATLGPGDHVYFVDACRTLAPFSVGNLTLPTGRASTLGASDPQMLFAALSGLTARSESAFVPSLMQALRGDGAAKEWVDDAYWVTFPRVSAAVKAAVAAEQAEVDERPGRTPAQLHRLTTVPTVACTIEVEDAEVSDRFVAHLWGAPDRYDPAFTGRSTTQDALPGDYHTGVSHGEVQLAMVDPTTQPVPIYQETTLRFRKGTLEARAEIVLADAPERDVMFRVERDDDGVVLFETRGGKSRWVDPGNYGVTMLERGEPIGRAPVVIGGGDSAHICHRDLIRSTPVHESMVRYMDRVGANPALVLSDFMDVPDVRESALHTTDPALLLTLLGGAAICDVEPYRDVVQALETLDDLDVGASVIYILDTPTAGGTAEVVSSKVEFRPLPDLNAVSVAVVPVRPGPHFLHLEYPVLGTWVLSTHAFPNRATLVVVARIDDGLAVRQHALPIGHLADELYPRGRIPGEQFGLVPLLRYADTVQSRFARRVPVISDDDHREYALFAKLLERSNWPDPITPLIAAYDAIRQGRLTQNPESLVYAAHRLEEEFAEVPDVGILAALTGGLVQSAPNYPLLLDALLAGERVSTGPGDSPDGGVLDFRGPWLLWRGSS